MPLTRRAYSRKSEKAVHSLENLTGVSGLFITFTLALQAGSFGNLVSVLAAIGAAATVAVGFGMRDQVSNLVAGILIHLDNPFIKGDYIKLGDTEGVVKEIKLRATTLNGGGEKKVVPNAALTTGVVKNYTKGRKTRVSISTDVETGKAEKASQTLTDCIEETDKVLNSPEPEVNYRSAGKDGVELEASFYVKNPGESADAKSTVIKNYVSEMKEE
ncbi:MAG: mechanosensitive ion channel family protein [Candidatus Nanohaloarchaea archaeon]